MGSEQRGEQREDAEARQRREEALRALGQQAAPPPGGRIASLPATRKRRRVLLNALAVVALVAVLAGVGTVSGLAPWARRATTQSPKPLTIRLALNHVLCPSQVAWSPDGTRIAVLAQTGAAGCNNQVAPNTRNVVALFGLDGQLIRLLDVDVLILGKSLPTVPTVSPTAGPTGTPVEDITLRFFTLSWSPDGREIAVEYALQRPELPPGASGYFEQGVALLKSDGSSGRLLRPPATGFADVWNTQTGQGTQQNTSNPPQALAFAWTADGQLVPQAAPDASKLGPVGNPIGGQSFSAWQPGSIAEGTKTGELDFSALTAVWSPDGRLLAPYFAIVYFLSESGPSLQPNPQGIATVTYRDAAMRAAVVSLKAARDLTVPVLPLAWRPDGQRLAALVPDQTLIEAREHGIAPNIAEHVAIYDCASGRQLGTLSTAKLVTEPVAIDYTRSIRWSPDGRHVLLLDTAYSVLTVWGPGGLPA
ncbi:MAG TPA: hypothetical protein VFY89_11150 [Ktedonobacterales bacterium]